MKEWVRTTGVIEVSAVVAIALLAACATPSSRWRAAALSPCADSTYGELMRQHVDSLSQREWQRLQHLDRDCANAQALQRDGSAAGSDHHGSLRTGHAVGIMTLLMLGMMISMW